MRKSQTLQSKSGLNKFLMILLVIPLFQGCGLSGAYIYFGDKNWTQYLSSLDSGQKEAAQDFLKAAYGNYKDSLTYDEKRYPDVYVKLADTEYLLTNRPNKSIGWCKKGLSVLPEHDAITAALGKYTFYYARDEKDPNILNEAKDHYRKALIASPLNSEFNAGLMKVYFYEIETNRFEARESRNKYLISEVSELMENVVGDESAAVEEARGIFAYIQGDYKTAIEKLTAVLQASNEEFDNRKTQFYLARSYVETKRYNDAIELTNLLAEKYPEDIHFRGERCLAYFLRGDKSAGRIELDYMEKNAPEYHEFFYRVGKYFYSQSEAKKAKLYLLKAYRTDGENGNYAFALGETYLLEGNSPAARKFFAKAKQAAPVKSDLEKKAQQRITEIGN